MRRSRSLSKLLKEKTRQRSSEVIAASNSDLKSSGDEVRGSRSLSRMVNRVSLRQPNEAQQGARANDHGCHDPCSEQHGSRQPRSWLILNVRQRRMLFSRSVHWKVVN